MLWQELELGRVPGIGYILHRPFWGQGYATEGSEACLRYIFHTLREKKAYCLIRPENEPSLRVAERLRLTLEGEEDYKGYRHLIFTKSAEEPIGGNFEEQPSPKEP